MGRPRKPAALREAEGNRGKRDIPITLPLNGTPRRLTPRDKLAARHFKFLAAEFGGVGVLKLADSPALAKLADLWARYWLAADTDEAIKLSAAWDRAASKLGLQVIDRSRIIVAKPEKANDIETRFFKVTG